MLIGSQTQRHAQKHVTHTHTHTQQILHTDAFTHKSLYTEAFTHRRFYRPALLFTNTFTHRRLYTQTLLRTNPQFLTLEPHFMLKGCSGSSKVAILLQFLKKIDSRTQRKFGNSKVAILLYSLTIVGAARGLKREKKKKERDRDRGQEGKTEREREREKEKRCVKMCRCEDVKMYSRPPLLEQPFAQTLWGIVIGFLKGLVPMNNV